MKRTLRNPVAILGLSGVLALGVVGAAGVALAQESPTPSAAPDELTPAATAEVSEIRGHGILGLAAIIEASGLDRQVFIDGFEDGQTVAEVLEANGLDPEAIKAEVLAKAEEALDSIMESTPDLPLDGPRIHFHFGFAGAGVEELAELLGITEDELTEALRDGQTVAEIAEAHGVDVQSVIDGMVAAAQEKLNDAVANGRLTQEQADEILENLPEQITEFVNEGGFFGRGERGFHREGRFEGRFGGPGWFPFGDDNEDSEPDETESSIIS